MGYDYSGYGASTGTPTVNNTLADITAVLHFLQSEYSVAPNRVILYGQSVGSGPSCYLASIQHDLAGVVLHSPLLSGVRVLKPHVRWWPAWADIYPNHTLAPKIRAPVLVMHVRRAKVWVKARKLDHRQSIHPSDTGSDEA